MSAIFRARAYVWECKCARARVKAVDTWVMALSPGPGYGVSINQASRENQLDRIEIAGLARSGVG
jgi:hypothetical protein